MPVANSIARGSPSSIGRNAADGRARGYERAGSRSMRGPNAKPEADVALDLILKGGRIIDPAQRLDTVADIGFAAGRVAKIGADLAAGPETDVRDVSGHIVVPGLIDLHTHVYWGGTSLGIDVEGYGRASGVTTCVDAGSAGPGNFRGFRKHVIESSAVRILAFLHVSFAGIYAFSESVMVGESEELRLMAPSEAVAVAQANRDVIVGIKVRVGRNASGRSGTAPLDIALQAADEAGLPLMCHIDFPPPNYEDVLERLRPGDILTHAFRPFPNAPIDAQGRVKDRVLHARQRGVQFDIGHGKGAFAFKTARSMLANGFYPDTISSDIHALCINGPAFDQVTTLSKFFCLGMPLNELIAATTVNAATAVKRPELGSLKPSSIGDATVLAIEDGRFDYIDVVNEHMVGNKRIVAAAVVIGGRWWHPHDSSGGKAA
jgi:dihydroorotase